MSVPDRLARKVGSRRACQNSSPSAGSSVAAANGGTASERSLAGSDSTTDRIEWISVIASRRWSATSRYS
ncbi:hypothetical protein D3C87_2144700 [compost metagenome]